MALQVTAALDDPDLLFLPWDVPLEDWPEDRLVTLPRGISRHVVRFVRLNGRVYAVKESPGELVRREYNLLRELDRLGLPRVDAVGVVDGRVDARPGRDGEPLAPALVTRHLAFSLPYRALFSTTLRPDTARRLLDALALLLVQLHTGGFMWRDCSLSNTLFRRDAGAFAAYLVDAETGELHEQLSDGQRAYDLDTARINIAGELLDLEAGGMLHESVDPVATADQVIARYEGLWAELTRPITLAGDERYKVWAHVARLNRLGFDVQEIAVRTEVDGDRVVVQPKVVDSGHHSRRLLRLTGLDVEENQARRLLNDLDDFRSEISAAATGRAAKALRVPDDQLIDEELAAHRWATERFEPVVRRVPRELRGKLEPAEMYHEVLEHRWFMSEHAGRDVGLIAAADDYVREVLTRKPDERAVLGARLGTPSEDAAAAALVADGLDATAAQRLSYDPDTGTFTGT